MQKLTVNIPDNKLDLFIDLAGQLGVTIERASQGKVLTQHQMDLVNEAHRKVKESPEDFLDWDEARKSLNIG